MNKYLIMFFLFSGAVILSQTKSDGSSNFEQQLNKEIEAGNFTKASSIIDEIINKNNLTPAEKYELAFKKIE